MGTWSAVTSQPDRFAAAVPMSGNDNGSPVPASAVADIPFWFFHAANDGTVGVSGSDNLVAALRNAGASTIYTRYDSGDHPIWPVAYTHPLLFQWLVAQTRGAPSTTTPPLLRFTAPTSDGVWQTEDSTLDIAGSADNGGNPIDSVAWDILAGANGTVSGTTDWSVGGIALNDGVNLLRVTATSPSEHDAYGGHTTFNDSLRVSRSGPPPEPGSVVAAINAGGDAYTAVDGTPYSGRHRVRGRQYASVEQPSCRHRRRRPLQQLALRQLRLPPAAGRRSVHGRTAVCRHLQQCAGPAHL